MVTKAALARWRVVAAIVVVTVAATFEFGLTASAGTFPKHFDSPTAIAFVGNHAFVTDDGTDAITLFNAVTKRFEHVPATWSGLELPSQVVAVGKYAWVCSGGDGTFFEFGPDGSRFVRTVSPQKPQTPFIGNLATYGGALWFSAVSNNSIY